MLHTITSPSPFGRTCVVWDVGTRFESPESWFLSLGSDEVRPSTLRQLGMTPPHRPLYNDIHHYSGNFSVF